MPIETNLTRDSQTGRPNPVASAPDTALPINPIASGAEARVPIQASEALSNPTTTTKLSTVNRVEQMPDAIPNPAKHPTISTIIPIMEFSKKEPHVMTEPSQAAERLSATTQIGPIAHLPQWQQIQVEDIVPGMMHLIDTVRQAFKQLEQISDPSWENMILPLERMSLKVNGPMSRIEHLQSVRREVWQQAVRGFASPTATPLCTSFGVVPLHWGLVHRSGQRSSYR